MVPQNLQHNQGTHDSAFIYLHLCLWIYFSWLRRPLLAVSYEEQRDGHLVYPSSTRCANISPESWYGLQGGQVDRSRLYGGQWSRILGSPDNNHEAILSVGSLGCSNRHVCSG